MGTLRVRANGGASRRRWRRHRCRRRRRTAPRQTLPQRRPFLQGGGDADDSDHQCNDNGNDRDNLLITRQPQRLAQYRVVGRLCGRCSNFPLMLLLLCCQSRQVALMLFLLRGRFRNLTMMLFRALR